MNPQDKPHFWVSGNSFDSASQSKGQLLRNELFENVSVSCERRLFLSFLNVTQNTSKL